MPSRSRFLLSLVLVLVVAAAYAGPRQEQAKEQSAQPTATAPIQPGAVLMIYRSEIKPGHFAPQQRAAANSARAAAKIPGMPTYLAMTAVAGPSEVWFMAPFASMGDLDKMNADMAKVPPAQMAEMDQLNDQETAHYNSMRAVLALYREDMSLGASFNVSAYRAMVVSIYRVRPGRARDFSEGAKKVVAAYKKADVGERFAGFQVLAGMPAGTFLFLRPIKKAADFLPTEAASKGYREAMGQEALDQLNRNAADVIASQEDLFFTFSPKMSNLPASYASADPYWRVTPTMAKAGEAKKPGEATKKPVEPVKK